MICKSDQHVWFECKLIVKWFNTTWPETLVWYNVTHSDLLDILHEVQPFVFGGCFFIADIVTINGFSSHPVHGNIGFYN